MFHKIGLFARDENGAVSVDWVVLTAGIVLLNVIALINFLQTGMNERIGAVDSEIRSAVELGLEE